MRSRNAALAFIFVAGVVVGHFSQRPVSAQRLTKTTNLITTDLGSWCAGKEVSVQITEAQPGTSKAHYHPGHSFTYVLDGTEVETVDGKTLTVKAGDLLHEEPMQLHTTENVAPVKLLTVRILEKGKPATTRP